MSDIKSHIQSQIDANPVMLFMKGTPQFPQCGFSAAVVQILDYVGVEYGSENVLASDELRHGIKEFSDWPTIPQLYVKGEFVGGCDIVREMFENGELKPFLAEKGLIQQDA
ncbi:Grx4 family monothiol glutaredoxin [Aquisalinus flavus]|uniref:Glutaredoxin n=1 Tax=Aquisalinus flavus TaxID=1526572 RepID=A0A8J2V3T7_9PROT|nr:Grx4 family monothiol glutaredoxin [Aquisalinus flavus]MBD0426896.1 Grx4 family monothiol glutaredoxin [Aquisalinus flavus]UNE46740.1 Grx4 family monothiol glutaredoxin [Aquisalinus flavus]GGC96813.1 glutaredoxin [Aquisalinus flavus]